MNSETCDPSTIDLPPLLQIEAEIASRSLSEFVKASWHVIEPSTPLVWNWHLDAICEHLEAVSRGEIRRLLINIGPGFMKSTCVSVCWTAWEWTRRPETRWLCSSYAAPLSIRDNLKCRRLIRSDWYQQRWGNVFRLTDDQDAKTRYENDKTGYRIATSVSGYGTGERGNRVVVDDPHNIKERESEVKREAAIIWWNESMSTRLNDPKRDALVVIQQRVHENDLAGHILKQGGYEHLCLPTEFEPDRRCTTSIGWTDPREHAGDLLFPQRFGPDEVKDAKLRLRATGFSGQHQQRPAPDGGACFKDSWFCYWKQEGEYYRLLKASGDVLIKIEECSRFLIADIAGTEKTRSRLDPDYSVAQVWDLTQAGDLILVDQWREQAQTPDTENALAKFTARYDISYICVEWATIGIGVVQHLRRRGIAVRGIKAKGSKLMRSHAAQVRMEAGTIFFPAKSQWVNDALEPELVSFTGEGTNGHDDQVDCVSYAAIHAQRLAGAVMGKAEEDRDARRILTQQTEEENEVKDEDKTREMALEAAAAARRGEDESMWAAFGDED